MSETRYIAIEGPIGVGKTSLAKRLADSLDSELLLEEAEANPFLERFYKNPRGAGLPTQLFFLFQRVRQIEELRQADIFSDTRIADFLIDKDRLFAQVNLDRHDLVIYLQAPVDTLLFRIARRGIEYEQLIERNYLERLNEAYARFFHDYDASPLLIVNAAIMDPIHNQQHYEVLLKEIDRIQSGRHFFNPVMLATG